MYIIYIHKLWLEQYIFLYLHIFFGRCWIRIRSKHYDLKSTKTKLSMKYLLTKVIIQYNLSITLTFLSKIIKSEFYQVKDPDLVFSSIFCIKLKAKITYLHSTLGLLPYFSMHDLENCVIIGEFLWTIFYTQ